MIPPLSLLGAPPAPSRFLEGLSWTYGLLPRPLRRLLFPFSQWAFARFRRAGRWFFDRRLPIYILRSRAKEDGGAPAVLVFGRKSILPFIGRTVFGRPFRRAFLGHCSLSGISRLILDGKATPADLVFIHADESLLRRHFRRSCLILPEWVTFKLHLPKSPAVPSWRPLSNKSLRENLRRVRKYGYSFEVTTDGAEFGRFYSRMYEPFIRKRHGESAVLLGPRMLKLFFDSGALLLVRAGGAPLAGNVILRSGDELRSVVIGVDEKNPGSIRRGAMAASYDFTVRWARRLGVRRVDFGECRPFLDDGLVYYKKSWGMRLETYPFFGRAVALWAAPPSTAVLRFLQERPCILSVDGRLKGLVTGGGDRPLAAAPLKALMKNLDIPGLEELIVCSPAGFTAEAEAWAAAYASTPLRLTRTAPGSPGG